MESVGPHVDFRSVPVPYWPFLATAPSPALPVRPQLRQKRPCRARLMREMPGFVRNRGRLYEEIVRLALEALAGPREVDHGIDHEIGHVNALRADLTGDRFGENALRGLGRREAGEVGLAAYSRGVAGADQRAAIAEHLRRSPACEMQKRHHVDLEVALQDVGRDIQEGAEGAADGIVDHDLRWAGAGENSIQSGQETFGVRDVAGHRKTVGHIARE